VTLSTTSAVLFWLSFAGLEALDPQAEPGGALGCPPCRGLVLEQAAAARAVRLEVVGQPAEHLVVLLGVEDLGRAVQVRGDVVPRRDEVAGGVPAGRDVVVRPLHDDEQLVLTELVQLVVRAAEVAVDGEVVAALVQQDGVVRGDEPGARGAHEGRPRVVADEPLHLVGSVMR
jgi:hypothetical protein